MWADAQVWIDVLSCQTLKKSFIITDVTLLPQHTCICTIHAQLHIHKHSFDEFMICKKKKVTNIHSHKKSEVGQWTKDQINRLNCSVYVLPLFTLLSQCLYRSKWAIKWWMIMLACVENNSSDSENPTHTQSLIQTLTLRVIVNKTLVIRSSSGSYGWPMLNMHLKQSSFMAFIRADHPVKNNCTNTTKHLLFISHLKCVLKD